VTKAAATPGSMAESPATHVLVDAPRSLAALDQPPVTIDSSTARLGLIRRRNAESHSWTLVLDDDPTGTQTVRDVPVLTSGFTDGDLDWASRHPSRMTFALTNSRSLDAATAERLTVEIVTTAARVAGRNGLRLRVVSRSDSTLRGHFAIEIAAAHRALAESGIPAHGTVFVPAFLEAGRVTALDVQWVSTPEGFVPAARTEYARDKTFGYDEEHLRDWVITRTGTAATPAPGPASISLTELRAGDGVAAVGRRLGSLARDQVVIANAVRSDDLEVLMLGILDREDAGQGPVIRSGPSFVRACAGQAPSEPLARETLPNDPRPHGLLVVGSHTDLTNAQVELASQTHELLSVELDAAQVVNGGQAEADEVARASQAVINALALGDVMLRTSREVLTRGRETPLKTSGAIANALVSVVQQVTSTTRPRFLIAKGGITSSDLAVRALGVRRAMVLGQLLPGTIPFWKLLDGHLPGLPYVVFPGNVGGPDALNQVLTKVTQ
jgi:uncharacterized protein YgbK (DUF1537 family)